jgi:hypothetical protein
MKASVIEYPPCEVRWNARVAAGSRRRALAAFRIDGNYV